MQGLGLLLNYMTTTSSLLPIIVYLCTNNVIKRFLVAFMSSLTVIELLFYLTWTKKHRLQYFMVNYNALSISGSVYSEPKIHTFSLY